jgi:hypothetical protein
MMDWQFCPYCGDELDTGWECNGCGQDWIELAFPWWERASFRPLTNNDLHSNSADVSDAQQDKINE